jgi:ligand-binding sensor protein
MAYSLSRVDFISPEKLDHMLKGFTDVTAVADIIAKVNGYPITKPHNFTRSVSDTAGPPRRANIWFI